MSRDPEPTVQKKKPPLSPELKAQKRRNAAIAAGLVAFMVIIFLITAMRLMQNIADRSVG